jgi:7-keto-8-aminopelargonate synthetase-like enzyme
MLYDAKYGTSVCFDKLLKEGIYVIGFFLSGCSKRTKRRIRVQLSAAHDQRTFG